MASYSDPIAEMNRLRTLKPSNPLINQQAFNANKNRRIQELRQEIARQNYMTQFQQDFGAERGDTDALIRSYLENFVSGKEQPITPQVQSAMLAQAQDPIAAEFAQAQTATRNKFGNAGFGPGGGGQASTLRKLRDTALKMQMDAGNQALVKGAQMNFAARQNAAGLALPLIANFRGSTPLPGPGFVPKFNVPPSQAVARQGGF